MKYLWLFITLNLFNCVRSANHNSASTTSLSDTLNINCKEIKKVYPNGKITSVGRVCADLKEGQWKEYYEDGDLKWEGIYKNGIRQYDESITYSNECHAYINKHVDSLKIDEFYCVRINALGMHPSDLIVKSDNGTIKACADSANYNFELSPKERKDLHLEVYFAGGGKLFKVCEMLFPVQKN